jgi:hypothetical protein
MSILSAVKKTINYSEKYGGKLTKKQLFERLISNKVYKKEEINSLNPSVLWTSPFDKRETFAKQKTKKAKQLAKLIENKFKDILFLGVTGSVAAEYPKKNDDIDLIIITRKNKLWLNRFKLRWFVFKNKIPHRKYGQKENRDEFCFNLWLDENNLLLPKNRQNLQNAIDLILMKPLINKSKIYKKFIIVNSWAKKWVATGYASKISDVRCQMSDKKISDVRFQMSDKIINWLMFWPQFWYMKKRIKKEKINLHQAFFHR